MKLYVVWGLNELGMIAKMILVCKRAKNEDVKGFEVQTSQEWS